MACQRDYSPFYKISPCRGNKACAQAWSCNSRCLQKYATTSCSDCILLALSCIDFVNSCLLLDKEFVKLLLSLDKVLFSVTILENSLR